MYSCANRNEDSILGKYENRLHVRLNYCGNHTMFFIVTKKLFYSSHWPNKASVYCFWLPIYAYRMRHLHVYGHCSSMLFCSCHFVSRVFTNLHFFLECTISCVYNVIIF